MIFLVWSRKVKKKKDRENATTVNGWPTTRYHPERKRGWAATQGERSRAGGKKKVRRKGILTTEPKKKLTKI